MSAPDALAAAVMFGGLAVGAFARGFSGFGFSAILVASWSLVGPPERAVAVALMLEVAASVMQAAGAWRDAPWRRVGLLLAGAALGTPCGVALLSALSEQSLRLVVSGLILAAALALLAGFRLRQKPGPAQVAGVGFVSGVCNGAVAMGGMPVAVFLGAEGLPPATQRAAVIVYFFLLDLIGLAALGFARRLDAESLGLAALCLPALAFGMWLGGRRFLHASPESFRRATLALLLGLSTLGLWRAFA